MSNHCRTLLLGALVPCPPCRRFTPELAEYYKQMKEKVGDKLEIVFVSSDRSEDEWREYFGEMP